MKTSKLLISAAVLVGAAAITHGARAGTLVPSLARLSTEYARTPQKILRTAGSRQGPVYANAFGPHVNGSGEVQVYIHYRPGQQPATAALHMLGADRIKAALGVVQAWVPVSRLHQLAGMAGVTRVGLPAYAIVRGLGTAQPRADTCSSVPTGLNIDIEGIDAENVRSLQNLGVTGSGVKVGIISNGADCISSSQTAGYLPATVWVDPNLKGSGDEGTAMLEEVHAMAPGAALGFCGPSTSVDFVTCYQDFATWGANIISDDLGFPNSFFYNDTAIGLPFINGVQSFAQNNPDISLVTAAGNDRADYYQATYAPSTAASPITLSPSPGTVEPGGTTGRTYQSVMDIGGNPYETVTIGNVPAGFSTYFLLTWDDPLNGPYDDLDLYLVDSNNNILDASTYDQASDASYAPGSASWNPPAEYVSYTNTAGGAQTLRLIVMCYVCNQTSNLLVKLTGLLDGAGAFSVTANGGVYGQAALPELISAAAAHVNPTLGGATVENFSQTGPYIGGDWLNGTTSVPKPDITGIDGVTVSGAGGFSTPFYGTSAASPNVASVIALLRSALPNSTNTAAQWAQVIENTASMSALTGSPTADEAGAGLIDASAAAASLDSPITAAITAPTGTPISVHTGESVQFQATCSYAGSRTLNYNWNFGTFSGIPDSSQLTPPAVKYTQTGTYTVTFTCSDSLQSAQDTTTVSVTAPPSSGGGGGAFGWGVLAGLAVLAGSLALRRRS